MHGTGKGMLLPVSLRIHQGRYRGMGEEDRWNKLEEIVRRVVREELSGLKKKPELKLVNGQITGITADLMSSWEAAYGSVDIPSEIRRAAAWLMSNPQGVPKNITRFLNNWFTKIQDRAAIRSIPAQQERREIKRRACAYCSADSVGNWGGYEHCTDPQHKQWAIDGMPRRMLGVVPKPVAGAD